MGGSVSTLERRREPRVTGVGLRARVRPGYRLVVIDLNCCGALVEAGRPLRPGAPTCTWKATRGAGWWPHAWSRCAVAAIDSESGVTYRAALAFNEPCEWVSEALTQSGYGVHSQASSQDLADGEPIPRSRAAGAKTNPRGSK